MTAAVVGKDGKSVFLEVKELTSAIMQTRIGYDVLGEDGKPLAGRPSTAPIHRLAAAEKG